MEREDIVSRLKRGFFLSVQLDPPEPGKVSAFLEFVEYLRRYGVETVDVNTSKKVPSADSLMVAQYLLGQEFPFSEVIPHVAVRDNGFTRFVQQIFGLYSLCGLRSLLALTGDPLKDGGVSRPDDAGAASPALGR